MSICAGLISSGSRWSWVRLIWPRQSSPRRGRSCGSSFSGETQDVDDGPSQGIPKSLPAKGLKGSGNGWACLQTPKRVLNVTDMTRVPRLSVPARVESRAENATAVKRQSPFPFGFLRSPRAVLLAPPHRLTTLLAGVGRFPCAAYSENQPVIARSENSRGVTMKTSVNCLSASRSLSPVTR